MIISDVVLLKNLTDKRGRIYKKEDLTLQLKDEYYGELLMGDLPEIELNLSRISHIVKNIRFVDDDLVGDFHILDTPMGMIAKSFFLEGIKLNTSIRAVGNVSDNFEISNMKIFTFDLQGVPK